MWESNIVEKKSKRQISTFRTFNPQMNSTRWILAGTAALLPVLWLATQREVAIQTDVSGTPDNAHKIPTQVVESMENEKEFEERRNHYFDHIHGYYPNWREVNRTILLEKALKRLTLRGSKATELFADGQFEAEWIERGSDNQAGNVRITDYHPSTEDIYAISDGGVLWKGNLDGVTWTPLNSDLVFSRDVIKVVDLPGGGVRILCAIGAGLWYSDDGGTTWTESTGIAPFPTGGSGIDLVQLNDADSTLVYLANRQMGPGAYINSVLYSIDFGASFTLVQDLSTNTTSRAAMAWPWGTDHAYIIDFGTDMFQFSGTTLTAISTGLPVGPTGDVHLEASNDGIATTLYALQDGWQLYKSLDSGLTFGYVGPLATGTWGCGFGVSTNDPSKLYYGEMEFYNSVDSGLTWDLACEWWEYYDDVPNKIHADVMQMHSVRKSDGTDFVIVSNHGGINVSYDQGASTENIGMADLNVGQFYDVVTSPINSNVIYGGTQDQGFLRTTTGGSASPSSFEQVISGDYGQMQLSNNGIALWTQYPGADFAFYEVAATIPGPIWYNFDGLDMPNWDWIVPTGPPALPGDDYILAGGGNLSGGSGSYLIKLEFNGSDIDASQYSCDFLDEGGATISAIETTSLQPDFIYVATANGHFFRSENAGTDFVETSSFVGPGDSWLFGADIFASKLTPGLVFYGGAGYTSPPVYMSTDSGTTFIALDIGMPNTMVHEMCMDPSEKFLFAATDAGPYVYSMETGEWYDLLGLSAPVQQYMSVEFVEAEFIVRFGTWGRGIWDLKLTTVAGAPELTEAKPWLPWPNPASESFHIRSEGVSRLQLVDLNGRIVFDKFLVAGLNNCDISHLKSGQYILKTGDLSGKVRSSHLIINK